MSKAFAEERERKQPVLFPVRIDDAVLETSEPWARKLRDQRNIGDFTQWKEHDAYRKSLDRAESNCPASPSTRHSDGQQRFCDFDQFLVDFRV